MPRNLVVDLDSNVLAVDAKNAQDARAPPSMASTSIALSHNHHRHALHALVLYEIQIQTVPPQPAHRALEKERVGQVHGRG